MNEAVYAKNAGAKANLNPPFKFKPPAGVYIDANPVTRHPHLLNIPIGTASHARVAGINTLPARC